MGGIRVSFAPAHSEDSSDKRRKLWTCLGLEMETVDVLASTLQLQYHGGRPWVSEQLQGALDLDDRVTTVLLSAWHVVTFSDSRWLTIGTSSRSLVIALLTG